MVPTLWRTSLLATALSAAAAVNASAQPRLLCTGVRYCDEAASVAATITDFRTSIVSQNWRVVSTTVRFQNKTARPLTLGYLAASSLAIDEQGNRYVITNASKVR